MHCCVIKMCLRNADGRFFHNQIKQTKTQIKSSLASYRAGYISATKNEKRNLKKYANDSKRNHFDYILKD